MKKLIYKIEGYTDVYNPDTEELEQKTSIATVTIDNPTDEDIARAAEVAYGGEYTIEDDGQPDPEPSEGERIAQLEEALDMILNGVTE